ncbi:hypothetical protein [Azospirillum argentinense]|uniref:hypothetical protein n=1 Tax=Azospirillum argentinense TaxID=2970906 RepID=UPI0032DFAA0D
MLITKQTALFRADNLFRFVCPIFQHETEARVCLKLRELMYRGTPHEKRPGCAACIGASKCPIMHMMADTQREDRHNAYFSATPVVGRISDWVMKRIAPIVVLERHLVGVPPGQRAGIERCTAGRHESARSMMTDVEVTETAPPRRKAPRPAAAAASDAVDATVRAAQSGDLSAAVTAAASASRPEPIKPKPATPPPAAPKMSLLELARMRKETAA